VFAAPIWWSAFPAILKGYIDRVFTNGFAYLANKDGIFPLLTDKKVLIFQTHGQPL